MGIFSDKSSAPREGNKPMIEFSGLDAADIREELHGGPLIVDTENRIFGRFTRDQVEELMAWSGIFAVLQEKGYKRFHVELQYLSDQDQRIYVKEGSEILIHIRLKLSHFRLRLNPGAPQRRLLYIDWLMTRHPKVRRFRADRLFPGQEAPGLGIFGQISDFITNLALGVGAKGAFNIPEYFHDAVLFHRRFRFYDPSREACFRALMRDLHKHGAREISRGFAENRIMDQNGEGFQWQPGEMISALDPDLEEMLWNKDYFAKVVRELKRIRFSISDNPLPGSDVKPGQTT
ncbi:MAG: hypothetical protein HY042_03790 [Spirochaetia bacterium]|nr:hypothetical protein [Spirochaetia bacterium]